jgi:hypothetical protein
MPERAESARSDLDLDALFKSLNRPPPGWDAVNVQPAATCLPGEHSPSDWCPKCEPAEKDTRAVIRNGW